MRAQRLIRRTFSLAGTLLIAAGVAAVPVASAQATVRATPAGVLHGTGVLNDVVTISPRNVWAVGHSGMLNHPKTLIEHWNGTTWHRISVTPEAGWLNGVAATSAHDVWAVGFAHAKPVILHFGGTRWRRVASPEVRGSRAFLGSVTALSPRNAWAVGGTISKTLIEHWNGTTWRRVASPSPQGQELPWLGGVAAASANDVWAVGGLNKALILHWNGTRWRQVPSPVTVAMLNDVTAISAKNAWAVGADRRGTLVLHWNGVAWHRARSPAVRSGAGLIGISGTSARNLWSVGASSDLIITSSQRAGVGVRTAGTAPISSSRSASRPLILHWNGTAWRRIRTPVPANGGQLIAVYTVSGRNAWAVGCTKNFGNPQAKPLALHWNGARWK